MIFSKNINNMEKLALIYHIIVFAFTFESYLMASSISPEIFESPIVWDSECDPMMSLYNAAINKTV